MPLIDLNGLGYSKSKENAMIASKPEAGALATNTHAVDEYFYWKGTLHQATVSIAVGDTIALGTNVKIGVLADGITEAKNGTYGLYDQDTVDGASIVTFDDGADGIPLKNLTVNIEPVQDLHGQANPYPAGSGKNQLIFPYLATGTITDAGVTYTIQNDGTVIANNTATTTSQVNLYGTSWENFLPVESGETYTLTGTTVNNTVVIAYLYKDGVAWGEQTARKNQSATFTVPSDGEYRARMIVRVNNGASVSNAVIKPMLAKGSTALPFEPYSNICPITGWTGANVYRMGENIFDGDLTLGTISSETGQQTTSTSRKCSANYVPVKPSTRIACYSSTYRAWFSIYGYDQNKVYKGVVTSPTISASGKAYADIPSNVYYIKFNTADVSSNMSAFDDISFTYDLDKAPDAYVGTTYSITFPDAAGTVYGGTLDVTNGVLTVKWASVDLGTLTWYGYTVSNTFYATVTGKKYGDGNFLCSKYKKTTEGFSSLENYSIRGTGSAATVYAKDTNYSTGGDFKVGSSGTQLVYELATPLTYTLTPTEVRTLLGLNNIWADCGDIEELTYRKKAVSSEDMQALIESKNTLTQALIAPVLNEMKADTALVLNDFRIVDNQLYRITTNVAAGAKLTPYTNCNAVTITEILKYLLSN